MVLISSRVELLFVLLLRFLKDTREKQLKRISEKVSSAVKNVEAPKPLTSSS
jgi:hypothetical protein